MALAFNNLELDIQITLAFDQAQWNTSKYNYDCMKDEVSLTCPSSKDLGIQT